MAYAAALQRLHAEEAMAFMERVGVGTGSFKAHAARAVVQRWRREASVGRATKTARATPQILAGMGIGVRVTTQK